MFAYKPSGNLSGGQTNRQKNFLKNPSNQLSDLLLQEILASGILYQDLCTLKRCTLLGVLSRTKIKLAIAPPASRDSVFGDLCNKQPNVPSLPERWVHV